MQYTNISKNIKISKFSLGTSLWAKHRHNFNINDIKPIINYALLSGINFIDTAIYYNNYHLLKELSDKFFISSKSYCHSFKCIEKEFYFTLQSLNRRYIDFFLLHEQMFLSSLKGHLDAYAYLMLMKKYNLVKKIGVSTHYVKGVLEFAKLKYIDVIFAVLNYEGLDIEDGTFYDMKKAIEYATLIENKPVFLMEIFAEGKIKDIQKAIAEVLKTKGFTSIIFGVSSVPQLKEDLEIFNKYCI